MPVPMLLGRLMVLRYLGGMPPDLAELVRRHVQIVLQPRPGADDLQAGCKPEWRGCFFGHPLKGEDEGPEFWRSMKAPSGEELAVPVEGAPGGVIKLFLANIGSPGEVTEVLIHELAHFWGEDEDEVAEAGLGGLEREERPTWR